MSISPLFLIVFCQIRNLSNVEYIILFLKIIFSGSKTLIQMFFRRGAARESTPKCDDCKKALKGLNSETMTMISSMCAPFISVETRLKLFGISRDDDAELTFCDLYHCWFSDAFMLFATVCIVTKYLFSIYVCRCILNLITLLFVSAFLRQR